MIVSTELVLNHLQNVMINSNIPKNDYKTYRYPALLSENDEQPDSDVLYIAPYEKALSLSLAYPDVHFVGMTNSVISDPPHAGIIAISSPLTQSEFLADIQRLFFETEDWYSRIKDTVLNDGSYQDIINIAEERIRADIIVTDAAFSAIAMTNEFFSGDPVILQIRERGFHSAEILTKMKNLRVFEKYSHTTDLLKNEPNTISGSGSTCGYWYHQNGKPVIGMLMACATDQIPPHLEYLFRLLIPILKAAYHHNSSKFDAEQYSYEPFLRNLLDKAPFAKEYVSEHAASVGLPFQGIFQLIAISSDTSQFLLDHARCVIAETDPDSFSTILGTHIVLIHSFPNESAAYEPDSLAFLPELLQQYSMQCGISRVFMSLMDCKEAFEQSKLAIRYGRQLVAEEEFAGPYHSNIQKQILTYRHHNIYYFENISVYQMLSLGLFEKKEIFSLNPYLRFLKFLLRYDTDHASNYYTTLYAYLSLDRSATETSKILNINRTRLLYHIKKIQELLPMPLSDPQVRFNLLLSYRAMEVPSQLR